MKTLSENLKILIAALCVAPVLTACNTIRGAGEDVEATGEAVQNAAEKTEEELEEAF